MHGLRVPVAVRVGIVTDEPIRLVGLNCIFEESPGDEAVNLIPVMGNLEELLTNSEIGYILLDLNSSSEGLATLQVIRGARPGVRMIVIGPVADEEYVLSAISAGVRGYLDQGACPAVVRKAIEKVANGSIWAPRALLTKLIDRLLADMEKRVSNVRHPRLTLRERQVLDLILTASSNREIASQLGIEERTVKSHVGSLMRKVGADNRIELSLRALNGWGACGGEPVERRTTERRVAERRGGGMSPNLVT